MWLVDSSKFIDWIREGKSPTRTLRPFVLADQVVTCGVIRVEVVRGAIKPTVRAELNALFDAIPQVSLSPPLWKRVADLAGELDRRGIVLPATDLIIGCCALHAGASVVTGDPHFTSIPGLMVRGDLPDLG
jgi:predicted nucleic acid-binding protein